VIAAKRRADTGTMRVADIFISYASSDQGWGVLDRA
jgi:hypothetical protein